MLVDIAEIQIKAGDGGRGIVSFRQTKGNPRGGPDGGDGGAGGSVFITADHNLATLVDFRSRRVYKADSGGLGGNEKMTGADGEDIRIRVPVGTLVYEKRENEGILVGDLVEHGQELLICYGGRGGRGNYSFRSSTNRTPQQFTPGTGGEYKEIKLEVKLIADVGLVGLPNAGKSTLINQLTSAHAKVASYPFTTIIPNLGVCKLPNGKSIVIADIPGLIQGARNGKGLADEFLRHVERTRLLVHVIDPYTVSKNTTFSDSAFKAYKTIRKELEDYGGNLEEKDEIVVINKLDITEVKEDIKNIVERFKKEGLGEPLVVSAVTGEGISTLKGMIMERLEKIPKKIDFEVAKPTKVYTIDNLPNRRIVFRKKV
jgi:GTP-binding protein